MIDPLERLLAVEEITRLKARYCRFVDTHQWTALRGLLTDDATFDYGAFGAFTGADAAIAAIVESRRNATRLTVHHCHTPEIDVLGPDDATGIWAMSDIVDVKPFDPGDGERAAFVGWGHYHERYRREQGTWLLAAVRLERLRIDVLPASHFLDVIEPTTA